jgi:hypothetical protein
VKDTDQNENVQRAVDGPALNSRSNSMSAASENTEPASTKNNSGQIAREKQDNASDVSSKLTTRSRDEIAMSDNSNVTPKLSTSSGKEQLSKIGGANDKSANDKSDRTNKTSNEDLQNSGNNVSGNSDLALTQVPSTNKQVSSSSVRDAYNLSTTKGDLPALVSLHKPSIAAPSKPEADPVALMMARLNEEEKKYQDDKKDDEPKSNKKDENVWTSVGFAAGSFNTVTSGGSALPHTTDVSSSFAVSNSIVHDQSSASGTAYSVGLSLGGKIASRWVLQGGLNYMTQSSDYTTNAVVSSSDFMTFKVASINEIDKMSESGKADSRILNTAAYNVNNSLQYLSVPLQAGYLILNRDFGWQFNAGVSTDLFLKNTLTPVGGTLEKTSQGRGDDSPYRTVNFSGLVGTELSYRFGQHYRVAVNPGLRYPFSSIYKSDISVSAMPLTFDVGLKFRYIFN